MYEMNVEKEKAALEEAVRKRKEEEQRAEAAAVKLRKIQQEEGLTRMEGALRHRRQGEEVIEAEKKLQRLEAEELALNTKKGMSFIVKSVCLRKSVLREVRTNNRPCHSC